MPSTNNDPMRADQSEGGRRNAKEVEAQLRAQQQQLEQLKADQKELERRIAKELEARQLEAQQTYEQLKAAQEELERRNAKELEARLKAQQQDLERRMAGQAQPTAQQQADESQRRSEQQSQEPRRAKEAQFAAEEARRRAEKAQRRIAEKAEGRGSGILREDWWNLEPADLNRKKIPLNNMKNIETLFERINKEFQLGDDFGDPRSLRKIEMNGKLKFHPDKNTDKPTATKMFQVWNSCIEAIREYHPSQTNRSSSSPGR